MNFVIFVKMCYDLDMNYPLKAHEFMAWSPMHLYPQLGFLVGDWIMT